MTNGRDKGRRGESDVAGLIREWWLRHEPSALFIRTPLSGGWQHNTKAAAHFKACGDIMTTSPSFPFCVEVKWREQWSVNNFLDGKPTQPWQWWRQSIVAAQKQGEIPMMWFRRNRIPGTRDPFPWLVLIPAQTYESLVLERPDAQWSEDKLLKAMVDFGKVLPVMYDYRRFVAMDPRRFTSSRRPRCAE